MVSPGWSLHPLLAPVDQIDPSRRRGQRSPCKPEPSTIASNAAAATRSPWIAPGGRKGRGARTTASAITGAGLPMAFRGPPPAVGAQRGRREVGGRRIRCCSAAGRCASSITTPRSSSFGVERCTLPSGRRRPQECGPGGIATPWARSGACAGPGQTEAPPKWRWAGLETAKRSRRLTWKVGSSLAPPAPSGPSALAGARGELAELEIQPGSPGAGRQFFNAAEGSAIPHCRLHFLSGTSLATANKMVRRGIAPAHFLRLFVPPMPTGQPTFLILWGDEHRASVQPQLLQRWPDGVPDPKHRSGGQGRRQVHPTTYA